MKAVVLAVCALFVATCGAFGPSREDVARDLLAALTAGDRAAFDALPADDVPSDAYATTRAALGDRAPDDLEVVLPTGTDRAVFVELRVDDDAGDRRFTAALRHDADRAWRLVNPTVDRVFPEFPT